MAALEYFKYIQSVCIYTCIYIIVAPPNTEVVWNHKVSVISRGNCSPQMAGTVETWRKRFVLEQLKVKEKQHRTVIDSPRCLQKFF